jgi:putative DNA primase/helicase
MPVETMFEQAVKYLGMGFSVIPSGGGPGGKSPLVEWKEYQHRLPIRDEIEAWEQKYHPHLWGVVTGAVSGVFVIDCDTEAAAQILETTGLKPHTRTPRGGFHFWFKHPGFPIKTDSDLVPKLDSRGDGGFVNLIGRRADGEYQILISPERNNLYDFNRLPKAIKAVVGQPVENPRGNAPSPSVLPGPDISERILQKAIEQAHNGNRNQTGLWLACQLRDNRFSQLDCEPYMLRYGATVHDLGKPPYELEEALESLNQAFTRPPREPYSAPNNAIYNSSTK